MMNPPPEDYIPCYAAAIQTCGRLTLSEANALALFHMAERFHAYRRALEQIAGSGSSNAELAVQAANALQEEAPYPTPENVSLGSTP
jgi:hypothetical protein